MNDKFQGLVYVLIVIGLASFIADIENNKIESYLNTFISGLNIIVMGILAFYTFKINKKQMEISKHTLDITRRQMKRLEMNETNSLLGKLDEYINHNERILYMSLPHLSFSRKQLLLLTKYNDVIDQEKVKSDFRENIDMKINFSMELSTEEKGKFDYVERTFNNVLPNSVKARYTLNDIKKSYKFLEEFKSDKDFYRFIRNFEMPKHQIDILEIYLFEVFDNNENLIIPNLKIDRTTADQIYTMSDQVNNFLVNLKGLIVEEQRALNKV